MYADGSARYYVDAVETGTRDSHVQEYKRSTNGLFYLISAANIIVFVVGLFIANWQLADISDNPLMGLGAEHLRNIGATATYKIVDDYQYWRLLSSPFVNAGVLHIWCNLSCLWIFGQFLAYELNTYYIAVIYLVASWAGVLVSANIGDSFITAAASGPAFGFIGAASALLLVHHSSYRHHLAAWACVVVALAINLLAGATPFVDNSCNVGGFVAGFLLTVAILLLQARSMGSKSGEWLLASLAALAVFILGLFMLLALIGLPAGTPVGGCCNAWVCAPSPLWNCDAAMVFGSDCDFTTFPNGTVAMLCPRGSQMYSLRGVNTSNPDALQLLCTTYCSLSDVQVSQPIDPGANTGGAEL